MMPSPLPRRPQELEGHRDRQCQSQSGAQGEGPDRKRPGRGDEREGSCQDGADHGQFDGLKQAVGQNRFASTRMAAEVDTPFTTVG